MVLALAHRAMGRVVAAEGAAASAAGAVDHLERAVAAFTRLEIPYEAARTKLLLAGRPGRIRPQTAVAETRSAHATLRNLGAAGDADAAAALLRDLGVRTRPGPRGVRRTRVRPSESRRC